MVLPNSEFLEVHAISLNEIAQHVARLVDQNAVIVLEQHGPNAAPELLKAPDYETYISSELGEDDPVKVAQRADLVRESDIKSGVSNVDALLAIAHIEFAAELASDAMAGEVGAQDKFTVLGYENARSSVASLDDDIELTHTQIEGLDHFGTADDYEVALFDELVKTTLSVTKFGGAVIGADYTAKALQDEQLERWYSVLHDRLQPLAPLLVGSFQDESELDTAFGEIMADYQGTANEQAIGPMLQEMRDRAVAAKDSLELGIQFNLQLPPLELLADIVRKLRAA